MSIDMPPEAVTVYTTPAAIVKTVSEFIAERAHVLHVNRHYRGDSQAPFADHYVAPSNELSVKNYDGNGAFMGKSYITLSFDLDTDGLKSFSASPDEESKASALDYIVSEDSDAKSIEDLFADYRDYHLAVGVVGYRGKMNTSFERTPQYLEGSIVQERNMSAYSTDK
ncbi:MAG TPA: hypothetical protein VK158_01665 [Acidobacteriota bacterium]|nr:hypothetical protein [Acidobacteriota bacterium]